MSLQSMPFNLTLLVPSKESVSTLRKVTVLDTYDASGVNFHEDGLFSISTFGRLGSEERDGRFGYIDLKTKIFHPEVYLNLIKLKALYGGICSGKQYAQWDPQLKDFIPANELIGSTGFSFFMRHWLEIEFKRNASDQRGIRIDLLEKYRTALLSKHLVSPAGLRDVQVNERGQSTEDEINDLYRKLITVSNTLAVVDDDFDSPTLDVPRWTMQYNAVMIYQMIKKMVSGKKGWFQGKYGSRRTRNGTRNVITAMDTTPALLGSPSAISATDTEIGFAQTLRGALPFTVNCLMDSILGQTFAAGDRDVWLTNPKTWQRELVTLSPEDIDDYATRPGIEKLINRFFVSSLRNKPIRISSYYLGLIYVDDQHFKVFRDISELPPGYSRKLVSPLTLADLLFTACYRTYKKLIGLITRYPIAGTGSIYPTTYKVRTTTTAYTREELDESWAPMGPDYTAYNFPDRSPTAVWMGALSPHPTRLAGLVADFDGDQVSSPILYSNDVYREVTKYLSTKAAFVAVDGSLMCSPNVDTVALVVANLTGDPS